MLKKTKDLNKRRAHFKFFFLECCFLLVYDSMGYGGFGFGQMSKLSDFGSIQGLCVFQSQCTRFKNNGKMKDFDKRRIHFFSSFRNIFSFSLSLLVHRWLTEYEMLQKTKDLNPI